MSSPPGGIPGGVMPGGSARRICSSCARAAICWANSVVWMPWNRPSSQPTSCAWATLSSASLGTSSSHERQRQPLQLVDQLRGQPVLQLLDRALVDLAEPGPALLIQRGGADLLQQLPDHAADPHHLGWLLDHLHDGALAAAFAVPAVTTYGYAVRADHDDLGALAGFGVAFAHVLSLAPSGQCSNPGCVLSVNWPAGSSRCARPTRSAGAPAPPRPSAAPATRPGRPAPSRSAATHAAGWP